MTKKVTRVDKPANLRKQAGSALQASEERYRGLLTHLDAGVVVHAADTSIIMSNPRASALLGLSDKQMRGKLAIDPKWKFLKENRKPLPIEEYPVNQIASKRQAIKDLVLGINRPATNDVVWVSVNGFPVLDDKGEISEIVISFIDITDRKQAEETLQDKNEEYEALNEELKSSVEELQAATEELQTQNEELHQSDNALRESEEKYRNLFMDSRDGIVLVDDQGHFLNANPAYCAMLGFSVKELRDLNNFYSITPEKWQVWERNEIWNKQIMLQGYSGIYEKEYIRKNGTVFPVELQAFAVFDSLGKANYIWGVARDITERKRAEEELRFQSEIMKNIAEAIYLVRMDDGVIVYTNSIFERMFGYAQDEMLGKHVSIVNAPSEKKPEETAKEIMAEINDTGSWKSEVNNIKKDGATFWCYANVSVFDHSKYGRVLVAIHTDITARKQAEEDILEQKNLSQKYLQIAGVMMVVLNAAGEITLINRKGLDILGYQDEQELVGRNWFDVILPKNMVAEVKLVFNQLMSGSIQSVEYYENAVLKKNGETRIVAFHNTVFRDKEGKPSGILSSGEDMTDRKRIADALQTKTEELERYFSSSLDLLCIADTDGNFRRLNPEWEQTLGYSLADLEGKRFLDLVHPDDMAATLAAVAKLEAQDKVFNFENRYRCKDGSYRWIEWRSVPIGKLIYAAARDVTARKRAEEEKQILEERLTRSEKMESLGLLAGGVAHDLNNVLGIVVGYSEMVLDAIDEKSPLRKDLTTIFDGGQRAAAIVDDLLTLARRGVVGKKVLNLNKLIADFKKSPQWSKLLTYHPSVKIQIELEQDLLNIAASSIHLEKTLYNLVSNASEAMTKGGNININTRNQYIDKPIHGYDTILEGDYVVLSVSDEGDGISEIDLKRIFEPFYTKKIMGRSGTGLGLSVVWGTVKDHQGYIDVHSEEGKGTTFTLYFLITREDIENEALAVSMSEYLGNGQTLLIVDDVKDQRDLAARLLTSLNYKVSSVSSGEEAIKYLKDHQPDLIVLDMIMDPGMDGLDTYKSVLEINPKQKAIIVSGFSESDRVKEAKTLGAGAYIKKPYIKEKLGLAVKKELARK